VVESITVERTRQDAQPAAHLLANPSQISINLICNRFAMFKQTAGHNGSMQMRASVLGLVAITVATTASVAALGQINGDPREAVIRAREVIANNWELVSKEPKGELLQVVSELQSKSYTELYVIKIGDEDQVCTLLNCHNIKGNAVVKLADAVLSARDKEENAKAAPINSRIAMSGAVLAVLSFAMSAWSTAVSLRSKKSSST
jgi:hypothetical protein